MGGSLARALSKNFMSIPAEHPVFVMETSTYYPLGKAVTLLTGVGAAGVLGFSPAQAEQ